MQSCKPYIKYCQCIFEDDTLLVSHSLAIVDDEPDSVQLFEDMLTRNGYNVVSFTNPLVTLEHVKENQEEFDLILVDYKMTPIDGYDFAKKIGRNKYKNKINHNNSC